MHLISRPRPAYVFLITVLVIGAIASVSATSLVLLGISRQQSSLTMLRSAQAMEFARTCAERALRSLRADLTYDGGQTVTFSEGSCTIRHLGGPAGNEERAICTQGQSDNVTRRLEISLTRVFPTTKITSWKEVASFTGLCP